MGDFDNRAPKIVEDAIRVRLAALQQEIDVMSKNLKELCDADQDTKMHRIAIEEVDLTVEQLMPQIAQCKDDIKRLQSRLKIPKILMPL